MVPWWGDGGACFCRTLVCLGNGARHSIKSGVWWAACDVIPRPFACLAVDPSMEPNAHHSCGAGRWDWESSCRASVTSEADWEIFSSDSGLLRSGEAIADARALAEAAGAGAGGLPFPAAGTH